MHTAACKIHGNNVAFMEFLTTPRYDEFVSI